MPSTKPRCTAKVRDSYGRLYRCSRVAVHDDRCPKHQIQS